MSLLANWSDPIEKGGRYGIGLTRLIILAGLGPVYLSTETYMKVKELDAHSI